MKKIKRPLAAFAVLTALVSFIFARFFPDVIKPPFIKHTAAALEEGDEITVKGRIYKIQEKTYSVYVFVKNSKVSADGNNFEKAGEVLLVFDIEEFEESGIKTGFEIEAQCSTDEFSAARNNGNYDEEAYYESLGIFLKASVKSVQITGRFVNLPAWIMAAFKDRITESFEEILGESNAAVSGIFTAVVTGDKSSLTSGTKSLYSENGIAHILAISGLHISIIGMGLFSLLKKYSGPRTGGIISSLIMFLYCLMCGMSVSALRATIMFTVHMAAYFFGRRYDLFCALSLACVIILFSNPFYILNSGFILSFLAILSVGIVSRNIQEFVKPESRIEKSLISGISVTITSLPVVAGIYYSVPLYGVILNLTVIPLMSFVLGSGLAGGIAGIVNAAVGRFFIGLGYYTVYFINLCCYLAGLMWMSTVVTGAMTTLKIIFFYLLLCLFVYFLRQANLKERGAKACRILQKVLFKMRKIPDFQKKETGKGKRGLKRRAVFAAVMLALFLIVCINPDGGELEIIMFDVDQGDGILIKTPEGVVYMIDGGSSGVDELWSLRLESALEYEGITKIDYSIITHPDSDHISGVLDLLSDKTSPVEIENILIPFVADDENYTELVQAAEEAGVNVINIHTGMSLSTDTVVLTCIHPDEGETFDDTNEYSAVLSLEYGEFTALFTGDIGEDTELALIEDGKLDYGYDLLKVAHHGSKYSSCEGFLSVVSPKTAIISAGVDNSYGHPAQETLNRLAEAGAEVYVTSQIGEIKITVNKEGEINIWTKF